MRISAGSRGLSRTGGNIHVHLEIPFIMLRPTIKRELPPGETVLITEDRRVPQRLRKLYGEKQQPQSNCVGSQAETG